MSCKVIAIVLTAALAAVGPAAARTAHYGGMLTLGTSTQPNSLDPTQSNDPGLRRLLPNYCLSLYTYASNHGKLELDPILAAAPPAVSADKLTYTIQLRQGIEFNDGTPFNAQAVVARSSGTPPSGLGARERLRRGRPRDRDWALHGRLPPDAAQFGLHREPVSAVADGGRQRGLGVLRQPDLRRALHGRQLDTRRPDDTRQVTVLLQARSGLPGQARLQGPRRHPSGPGRPSGRGHPGHVRLGR